MTVKHTNEELIHYGVKGMKWGVRRTDEQLSRSKAARAERSAKKTQKRENKASELEAIAGKLDVSIKELKAERNALPVELKTTYTRRTLTANINENTRARDQLQKEADAVRSGKLTRNQKMLIAGGIALTGIVAAGYVSTKIESGEFNALKLQGAAFLRGEKFEFKKNASFASKNLSPDDILTNVVKGINPKYKEPGGVMNCRRNSFAYELRRRGLDVVSTPTSLGVGHSESGLINALTPGQRNYTRSASLSSMVTDAQKGIRGLAGNDKRTHSADTISVKNASNYRAILNQFSGQPNGSRGEIVFNFGRFGHSMSYEIFDGKPVIFDTQKAQKYNVDSSDWLKLMDKWGTPSNAEATRLDNVDLDLKFLSRWVTNS